MEVPLKVTEYQNIMIIHLLYTQFKKNKIYCHFIRPLGVGPTLSGRMKSQKYPYFSNYAKIIRVTAFTAKIRINGMVTT